MTRRLSYRDVLAVVERVPDLTDLVLVGGQALNFWAESLGIAGTEPSERYGAALSDDIDFLGSARAALAFGQATDADVQIASMDAPNTPNTALVTLDLDGEEHLIDFLSDMHGFSPQELERVRRWALPAMLERGAPRPLHVMHPVHCLQSQLANVYGRVLDRRAEPGGERYVARVRLAIESCRRIVARYLDQDVVRSALAAAEKVHELSLLESAMRAHFEDGLEVDAGIPDHPAWPPEFREKRRPQMRRLLEHSHEKAERTRKRQAALKR